MMDEQTWIRAEATLREVFRLSEFREGQEAIVRSVLGGQDTLAVMPTGSGKSLCYQLPGVVLPGLTLVISPLIALMKDQVDSLVSKGIRAAHLNSTLTYGQQQTICEEVLSGRVKFLFVAPERIRSVQFQRLLRQVEIGLLAVDEAHCISQWGHDFRPDYRRLGKLRSDLGMPVTIALTATASPEVQADISEQLNLRAPSTHILGFDRLNLCFGVFQVQSERERQGFVLEYVRQRIQQQCGFKRRDNGCGILYASTVKQAEQYGAYLREHGIRVGVYHASLPPGVRAHIQDQFMHDAFHCLIATTAFGMGVDKPDIRYVLHLSMSSSVEAYTQESGRAGRDGKPAECMLLYSGRDVKIQEFFIDQGCPDITIYRAILDVFGVGGKEPTVGTVVRRDQLRACVDEKSQGLLEVALRKLRACDAILALPEDRLEWRLGDCSGLLDGLVRESLLQKKVARQQLKNLTKYVFEETCRTKFILRYFGSQDWRRFRRCHHCDLCGALPPRPEKGVGGAFPPEPVYFVILKILSSIARCQLDGFPVDGRQVMRILTGSTGEPSLTRNTTFGLLGYMDGCEILVLIGLLQEVGWVSRGGHGFLSLTSYGKSGMSLRGIQGFPAVLQGYLTRRFPRAALEGTAWRPE